MRCFNAQAAISSCARFDSFLRKLQENFFALGTKEEFAPDWQENCCLIPMLPLHVTSIICLRSFQGKCSDLKLRDSDAYK
jgi:hypothetical protein